MAAQDQSQIQGENNIVDQAVAEGGAYDIIRQRLQDQGKELTKLTQALNEARLTDWQLRFQVFWLV